MLLDDKNTSYKIQNQRNTKKLKLPLDIARKAKFNITCATS